MRLFCILTFALCTTSFNIDWDYHGVSACPPESFFATVGDFNITKKNFQEKLKQNPHLLVVASSSVCKECCNFERTLREWRNDIFNNPKANYNMTLKIGRVDLIYEPWFHAYYPIAKVPEIVYFHYGNALLLQDRNTGKSIMYQVYKRDHYYEELNTEEQIIEFIRNDPKSLFFRRKLLIGVGLEEDVLKEFKTVTQGGNFRLDFKFGLVTDKQLALNFKSKHFLSNVLGSETTAPANEGAGKVFNLQTYGFPHFNLNSVYLVHFPIEFEPGHKTYAWDVRHELDLYSFYHRRGVESVERLNEQNYEMLFQRGKIMMVAFLDRKQTNKNHDLLTVLRQIAYTFPGLTVAWTYWQDHKTIARTFGIFHCSAPCLSVAMTNQDTQKKQTATVTVQFTYENVYVIDSSVELDFDGLYDYFKRISRRDARPGLSVESREANDNYQKYMNKFVIEEMDYEYLSNKALRNQKDYIVIFLRSFAGLDDDYHLHRLKVLRNFFKKVRGMEFVTLVYDLDSERDDWNPALKTGDVLLTTKEMKAGKVKYRIFKDNTKLITLVLELLKSKRLKLSKDIVFSEEEKREGINFESVFEGKVANE